jgi:hypothetical protein
MFPKETLPPPPSEERVKELMEFPPHPQAAEGKSWPRIEPPRPPPPGFSVGMPNCTIPQLLGGPTSQFYIVTPESKQNNDKDGASSSKL